ncbi:MAG: hypothetical protein IKQ70_11445, partial [Bacteroidales bacterium]|nr:hypothetical protein [Bacteroidales bacterium]
LWECAVPGIPVQTVVSTIRPIYTQTTFSPMLTLHTANLNMKPGMEYAWRVTVEDPHNQQKFANQGQSEIFTFTYKRKPEPVTGLRFSNRGLKITWTWDMDPAHTKYYFEYYDPQTGRTIAPVACDYAEFVRNMPQTGYHLKVRVRAECYGDPTLLSDYTPYLDTYLEPIPVPEYECGKVFPDREITNLELKHSFAPGEIVESKNGDTRYEIIFSEEKNGYLSGQFFMIMDCWGGAKIRCEFSKTQINTDNIVLKTIFHNVTDSTLYVKPETIRKEVEQAFFDAATVLTDFSIKDTVKLDKPYTYLYVNPSGKVMAVIDDKGKIKTEETTISATSLKENTLIQGKNGEELVLTKKGQVMGKTEFNATGGKSVLLKEYHRKSDSLAQWQINFSQYDAQTYAFDHIGSGNHGIFSGADYYPQVGSYDFRYKSVECGKSDKVKVEFDTYPEKDSVVFKDKYGVTYLIKDRILTFTGVSKADTNYIYAYRGDQKIGKLFLNTYQQKTYKVVFVRVNGAAKKLNAKEITKYLNKVYNQCAVSFEDSIDNITIDDLTSFSHGGSGILTVYNDDQKRVLQAYDKEMKDGVYYLFFIDNVTDKKDGSGTPVSGYMPRGYNAGFIYDGGSPHTIAHELGHGIAGLEHVFENSNNSGKTANLMDYANGEELWHFQWDQIQDPSRVWMKWNKAEEEGENKTISPFEFIISGNGIKNDEGLEGQLYQCDDKNKAFFYTYYDNKSINIAVRKKDSDEFKNIELELEKSTWMLNKGGYKNESSCIQLNITDKSLKSDEDNVFTVTCGGYSSQLVIHPYTLYITFLRPDDYNGEFLFDDAFNIPKNRFPDDKYKEFIDRNEYKHFDFYSGGKTQTIYAPVIGVTPTQTIELGVFYHNDKYVQADKNLSIDFEYNKEFVDVERIDPYHIKIKGKEVNNNGSITIDAKINDKVIGKLECYCLAKTEKKLKLIYVKFADETNYRILNRSAILDELNNHSLNQLFFQFSLESDKMDFPEPSSKYKNHNQVFNALKDYAVKQGIVDDENSSYDYYFITNISLKEHDGVAESFTPGCHLTGQPGGVQLVIPKEDAKYDYSVASFETPEKVTAHEMGHYVGAKHPHEPPPRGYGLFDDIKNTNINHQRVSSPTQKDGNFMDYSIPRRTWFKFQMADVNRVSKK